MPYNLHYQIIEALSDEATAIAPVELYNVDPEKELVNSLNRMAQPGVDGASSPLSARNPLSGEGLITSNLLMLLQYFAHELNLFPDALYLNHLRVLGLTAQIATSPLIELEFRRTQASIAQALPVIIRAGTKIRSVYYSDRYALITEDATVSDASVTVKATARIDVPGKLGVPVRDNEFTVLPVALRDFEAVSNTSIVDVGKDKETVSEVVARARSLVSRPGNRVISARDYQEVALTQGAATSAIALPRLGVKADGSTLYWGDLVTVAVYPEAAIASTKAVLTDKVPLGTRLEVVAGRVVPIDGTINVGIDPSLSEADAYNLVATAIRDTVNPPYAKWGNLDFLTTLSLAVEKVAGIFSFKVIALKHAITGVALSELKIEPYDLLEIQQSIVFTYN